MSNVVWGEETRPEAYIQSHAPHNWRYLTQCQKWFYPRGTWGDVFKAVGKLALALLAQRFIRIVGR